MNVHLLVIDPQNDFCDPNGSLFVPGADEDMKRLGGFIERVKDKLNDIQDMILAKDGARVLVARGSKVWAMRMK